MWMGPAALLVLAVLVAGCAPIAASGPASGAATGAAENAPRVYFTAPADGATVASPLLVTMAAQNFAIEPAGEVKQGAGHLHIVVDGPCIAAGEVVPNDETHLHYGKAQVEAELTLAPGAHTLCLQAADGAHVALPGDGMTQVINLTVE